MSTHSRSRVRTPHYIARSLRGKKTASFVTGKIMTKAKAVFVFPQAPPLSVTQAAIRDYAQSRWARPLKRGA